MLSGRRSGHGQREGLVAHFLEDDLELRVQAAAIDAVASAVDALARSKPGYTLQDVQAIMAANPAFIETVMRLMPMYWLRVAGGSLYLAGRVLAAHGNEEMSRVSGAARR